jgi:hypothetical protein
MRSAPAARLLILALCGATLNGEIGTAAGDIAGGGDWVRLTQR